MTYSPILPYLAEEVHAIRHPESNLSFFARDWSPLVRVEFECLRCLWTDFVLGLRVGRLRGVYTNGRFAQDSQSCTLITRASSRG
jgi:hypothetical protein